MTNIQVHIPEALAPYAADLQYFFSTMVMKLHVNRHKGTSKSFDVPKLVAMMKQEIEEMRKAFAEEGQFDVPLEAVDIANFAFLVACTTWNMTREDFEQVRGEITRNYHGNS